MMAGAMMHGAGARLRHLVRLLAGLAGMLLAAAAVVATQVPPRPAGRVVLAPSPAPVAMSAGEALAAQARITEALGVLRRHAIARRLAEADAVLAAVRAAADPEAVAAWEAAEAAPVQPQAPLAMVEEPPPPMSLSEVPPRPEPIADAPPVLPLDVSGAGQPADPPPDATPREPPKQGAAAITRLFIHHAARHADAQHLGLALPDGLVLAEIRAVRAAPARPDIRYFHAADRAAAERLAERLGQRLGPALPVRDFTRYRPLPQPGSIELWLAQP